VAPSGFRLIENFRLEGTTPIWTFAFADVLLEKRIWMEQGANTTYISYKLHRGCEPVQFGIKALVNYRDYHRSTHAAGWEMRVEPVENGLQVDAFDSAVPFVLLSKAAQAEPAHEWYYNFDLDAERYRGLDDREDHLHAGTFRATLSIGQTLTIVASTDSAAEFDHELAQSRHVAHTQTLLNRWRDGNARARDEG